VVVWNGTSWPFDVTAFVLLTSGPRASWTFQRIITLSETFLASIKAPTAIQRHTNHRNQSRQAQLVNIPDPLLAPVISTTDSLQNLAVVMRNTFDLAVGMSPLLVLHPKKLDTSGIRRDYLLAVSHLE
jgi:hypothetical protein